MTTFQNVYKEYAQNFYNETTFTSTEDNTISSALGSWINLAFLSLGVSHILNEEEKATLAKELCCPISDAQRHLSALLNSNPRTIALALGFWTTPNKTSEPAIRMLKETVANTTDKATVGPVPSQKELDTWVEEKSLGIITEFPDVDRDSLVALLANVVATKIDWAAPYETTSETNSYWGKKLLTERKDAHLHLGFTEDNEAYVIHWKEDQYKELTVYSIIGEDSINNTRLYKLLNEFENKRTKNDFLRPADVEKFENKELDFLTIERIKTTNGIQTTVELPAWNAEQTHNLDSLNVGFGPVSNVWLKQLDMAVETKQVAKAAYHKEGFEAAALTLSMIRAGSMPHFYDSYSITALFNKPYLVAAYSNENNYQHLPLFATWVKVAADVE